MPTGVFRQNKKQSLAAFIAMLAEGRKPSGIAIADVPDGLRRAAKLLRQTYQTACAVPLNYSDRGFGKHVDVLTDPRTYRIAAIAVTASGNRGCSRALKF